MSGSKIRNIAIVALLIVNILFLTVIILNEVDASENEREFVENISEIMAAGGVNIGLNDIRGAQSRTALRTSRVIEIEQSIAQALLGDATVTDRGVIYRYENQDGGVAEFYIAGEFEVQLPEGVILSNSEPILVVRSLLGYMTLETGEVKMCPDCDYLRETVVATIAYGGASIFNSSIEFRFKNGYLRVVEGRYVAGVEQAEDGGSPAHVGSALLTFLQAVRDEDRPDIFCTEILSIESGYRHRVVGAFGEGMLDPAWLLKTDGGTFMIDGTTGEVLIMG